MEEKWLVEKFEGSNWITWKFQLHVRHLLMAKGLWKFVDGSAVLAEGATQEEIPDRTTKGILHYCHVCVVVAIIPYHLL